MEGRQGDDRTKRKMIQLSQCVGVGVGQWMDVILHTGWEYYSNTLKRNNIEA